MATRTATKPATPKPTKLHVKVGRVQESDIMLEDLAFCIEEAIAYGDGELNINDLLDIREHEYDEPNVEVTLQ